MKCSKMHRKVAVLIRGVCRFLQEIVNYCAPFVPRIWREMDERVALALAIIFLLLVILLYILFPPF
jgi:hypothetical protein